MHQHTTEEHIQSPPTDTQAHRTMFMRLYYGEYPLAKTFWIFCVLFPLAEAVILVLALFLYALLSRSNEYFISYTNETWLFPTTTVIIISTILYIVFAYTGLWRAATKYRGKTFWAIVAKAYIILTVAEFFINTYDHFYPYYGT